jgi:peptide chain release factor 1
MVEPLLPILVQKLDELAERAKVLEQKTMDPNLVKNQKRSKQVFGELGRLRKIIAMREELDQLYAQIREAEELIAAKEDEELVELANEELPGITKAYEDLVEQLLDYLLTDEITDARAAILEIRAGAGGDEAALFARDLAEIYKRLCDRHHWKMKPMSLTESDLGGFKEAIYSIEGEDAFRHMRFEMGGHRVQRIPSTETQGRIHTSAATVAVLPEAEDVDVVIDPKDLEIQTTTSSGPGGQHVNKTESAVRITHLPTGIVVFCQEERSQHKNKAKAMRMLTAKVLDHERQKVESERAATRKSQVGSGDRSQRIRTYNFPQNRVTDHRIQVNYSLTTIQAGDLDSIFADLMRKEREDKLGDL